MTPWKLAASSEHSQQRALFAWANNAAMYGFRAAARHESYELASREAMLEEWRKVTPLGEQFYHPAPYMNLMHAVHNQGHGDKVRGAIAKAEGVKAGIPDVFLPLPTVRYHGLYLELKKTKGGVVSAEQEKIAADLRAHGYAVALGCKGWLVAACAICDYLGVKEYPSAFDEPLKDISL